MPKLLTTSNPKTLKGVKATGTLTAVLHLAPAKLSGANVCAHSTGPCRFSCLNTAGMGRRFKVIQEARIARAQYLRRSPAEFCEQLDREIWAHVRRARRAGLKCAVRLNGTSDIPYERLGHGFAELFRHPARFYDYSKYPVARADNVSPEVYHLTYSYTGNRGSWSRARAYLARGLNVAVVFRHLADVNPNARPMSYELPRSFRGVQVEDGDTHDCTYLRPAGSVLGLRAKGDAKLPLVPVYQEVNGQTIGELVPNVFAVNVSTLEGS